MKKISIDNIQLHNRRLVSLWQHDHFAPKPIKHLDGQFVSSNVFSVYVYTTHKEESVVKAFAQKVDDKIGDVIANLRATIRQEQRKLHRLQDTPILGNFKTPTPILINIDKDKMSPSTLALLKIYIALDNFIIEVHQAKASGDISATESDAFKNRVFKQLNKTLNELKITCTKFHNVRKNQ